MFPQTTQILVVDDSLNMRHMVKEGLEKLGFKHIRLAQDVDEANQQLAAASEPIGLIISDLNMPGKSGLDFLKEVRAQKEYENLPFILLTTESEKKLVIEAAMAGVSSYIVKPFNVKSMAARLKEAWQKHYGERAG